MLLLFCVKNGTCNTINIPRLFRSKTSLYVFETVLYGIIYELPPTCYTKEMPKNLHFTPIRRTIVQM